MKRRIHPLFLLLLALVGCKSCNKEEPPKPPPLPNAAFEIGEETFLDFYPADTIDLLSLRSDGIATAYVTFKAQDQKMDSYEWTIGTDNRKFTTRSLTLYFKGPDKLNVTLKVTKNGKADSLTKPLVLRRPDRPKLAGVWEGSYTHKPDSLFRVYILNGLRGELQQGDVDTAEGWPTGARGYNYVYKGLGTYGSTNGLYDHFDPVTNGASKFIGYATRNGVEYGDTLRFFWMGNNRLKVKASFRRGLNLYVYDRVEFNGRKIRW